VLAITESCLRSTFLLRYADSSSDTRINGWLASFVHPGLNGWTATDVVDMQCQS